MVATNTHDTLHIFTEAQLAIGAAGEKYREAKALWAVVEREWKKLGGAGEDQARAFAAIKQALPMVAKLAAAATGGGGLAALVADEGAFRSLISGFLGIFS